MRGLSARILALALGLVLATTIAAGLATVQFARASAGTEQRAELAAQAALVAPQASRLETPKVLHRIAAGLGDSVLTLFDAAGTEVVSTAPKRAISLIAAIRAAATRRGGRCRRVDRGAGRAAGAARGGASHRGRRRRSC